jgi:NAD dependent epimerase/dehydratase family enzyme
MSWIDDYVAIVLLLLENAQAVGSHNMTAPEPVRNAHVCCPRVFIEINAG